MATQPYKRVDMSQINPPNIFLNTVVDKLEALRLLIRIYKDNKEQRNEHIASLKFKDGDYFKATAWVEDGYDRFRLIRLEENSEEVEEWLRSGELPVPEEVWKKKGEGKENEGDAGGVDSSESAKEI